MIDRETVVNLIANTRTKKGLTVSAVLDQNNYKTGIKVSDREMATIKLKGDGFHPEWNYTIIPNNKKIV